MELLIINLIIGIIYVNAMAIMACYASCSFNEYYTAKMALKDLYCFKMGGVSWFIWIYNLIIIVSLIYCLNN